MNYLKKETLPGAARREWGRRLLFLPLLTLPFVTLAFWALGGGKAPLPASEKQAAGLNLQLPRAQLKVDPLETKLSDYEKADQDSLKRQVARTSDPLYRWSPSEAWLLGNGKKTLPEFPAKTEASSMDTTEKQVYQKLAVIHQQIAAPAQAGEGKGSKKRAPAEKGASLPALPLPPEAGADPELAQLNGMMDKIIQIQHPENAAGDKTLPKEKGQTALKVGLRASGPIVSLLGNESLPPSTLLYTAEQGEDSGVNENALPALVYGAQTLTPGSPVKLMTQADWEWKGALFPKGSVLYGLSELKGARMEVRVRSIRIEGSIYPVRLTVYDLDGMEGISVPGRSERSTGAMASDPLLQQLSMPTIDPSVGAQAAAAGVQTAKSLLQRKERQVRVTLPAGYQVLLRNEE